MQGCIPGEPELWWPLLALAPKAAAQQPRARRAARRAGPTACAQGRPGLHGPGAPPAPERAETTGRSPKRQAKILAPGQALAEGPNLCPGFPQREPAAAGHSGELTRGEGGAGASLHHRLLTGSKEELVRRPLSLAMRPTALSCTAARWQSVKVSRTWEEKSCCSALRPDGCSKAGSSAKHLATFTLRLLGARAKALRRFLPPESLAAMAQMPQTGLLRPH